MDTYHAADVIAPVVICTLSLLVAGITRYRPPRQINPLYGYRTARAMRTPATWQAANRYFAQYFWRLSWLLPLVALAAAWRLSGSQVLITLLVVWLGGILIGVVRTEQQLRRHFDADGQPRR